MFLYSNEFDLSMIYFLRCITKNFFLMYKDRTFNGLPIEMTVIPDGFNL